MKKSVGQLFASLLCFSFFGISCSNDFEVVDEWQNIPIVYGLLNAGDTAQYIRIEKAFLDPQTSAFILAQIPDTLYYPDATVKLIELLSGGGFGDVLELEKVDANNEGYPKDEGIFATSPNWVYKTTNNINPASRYRLEIITEENGLVVTAESEVIPDFDVFSPQAGANISFPPDEKTNFVWQVLPDARFFSISMFFTYREYPIGNPGQAVFKTLEWTIASKVKPEGIAGRVEVDGERFYTFIAANIPEDPGLCRQAGNITVHVDAGGEDLLRHIEVFLANQSGVTGSEPFPEYTNLSDGRGVFSSRYRKTLNGILLSQSTAEELATSPVTGHLGFTSFDNPCN